MNKTLYVQKDYRTYWERAERLFPFFLSESVSAFCSEAIKAKVIELELEHGCDTETG